MAEEKKMHERLESTPTLKPTPTETAIPVEIKLEALTVVAFDLAREVQEKFRRRDVKTAFSICVGMLAIWPRGRNEKKDNLISFEVNPEKAFPGEREKKTILITGAAGLIGGILIKALKEDYDLILLDKKVATREDNWIRIDVSEYSELEKVFGKGLVNVVIHLAGVLSKEGTWENVLRNNIIGTRNVFELAKEYGVERVIYTSSNRVVAGWEDDASFPKPITEEAPPNPLNLYGVSKLACEGFARVYWRDYRLPVICLRLGSVRDHDDPRFEGPNSRLMRTWLSHRDLVQIVELCIRKRNPAFAIYNVFSANPGCPYDITKARNELGYKPKDNSERLRDER